jgi:MFS transporter, Spinster family, sphingosine-1-phosphate transporter
MEVNNKLSKKASIFTVTLFILIIILDYADQAMLNPLVNTLLLDFFNDTSNVVPLGWVSFTFTILSAISMVIAGIYADLGSRKKICFTGSIIYSIFSIITIFTPHGQAGYVFFFITRALNGIGIGAIIPTIFSLVGDTVDPKKRATAFGYITVAMLIGRMGGLVIAGANTDNWRVAYFTIGLINLMLSFALLRIQEPQRGAQEVELKNAILEGAEYQFKLSKKDFKHIWSNKSNFWLIMNFIDTFPGSIILFLLFKYMEDKHNMQPDMVTILIILVAVFGAIGTILFGKLGDKYYEKDKRAKISIALFCNIFPIFFAIIFLSAEFWIPEGATFGDAMGVKGAAIVIFALVFAMFINQGVGPNWYSSLTDINLPEHRATMISIASFMDMVGNAVGPLIGAYIATIWGIQAAMWSVIIFWVLNVVFWIPVFYYIRGDLQKLHSILSERAESMKKIK